MTWTQWGDFYDASAAATTLERVYKSSPRVRAKLLVATQISMNQFLVGETILRQQLSEIVGTSVARVQLEFLQTSALRESDRGVYFAAFGISVLPDPPADRTGSSSSNSIATAIDQERERVIHRLQYGAIVREQNVTIASLTLFGTAMQLVDIALDGELFYPIDMKPWIAARIVVVPAIYNSGSSASTGVAQGLYAPSRDAYQSLRLRFLLAKTLLPLQLGTSDILIRETHAAPSASYHFSFASLIEIEIHLNGEASRVAADGYLCNGSLAQEFNAMEPQWMIGAIDVDPRSGILYSPPGSSSNARGISGAMAAATASSLVVSSTVDVTFVLNNVSFAHVASRKWRILERVAQFLSLNGCGDCQVGFKDVLIPPSDTAATVTHNDGDSSAVDAVSTAALDPINAPSTTLSFHIDTLSSNLSSLVRNLQTKVSSSPNVALCVTIGVHEENDIEVLTSSADAGFADDIDLSAATCALASYHNATQLSSQFTLRTEPFVLLNLTLRLTDKALNVSHTTAQVNASPFDQHRLRCALLVLFQQVAIYNEHLRLEATSEVPQADPSAEPLLLLRYKVTIEDESQRQGIVALFLSKRLERTINAYTNQRLDVVDRVADPLADGSPWQGAKLPGIALTSENRVLPALLRSGSDSSVPSRDSTTRVYRFQDPVEASSPSALLVSDPSFAPKCPRSAITSDSSNTALQCVSIQFVSDFEGNALFLREIESNVDVSSPSLVLPRELTLSPVPAPWIYNGAAAPPWIFYANMSSQTTYSGSDSDTSNAVVLRFRFEFATGYSSAGQSISTAFTLDVRVENEDSQNGSDGSRRISGRKSSFLALVASTGGNASSAFGHSHFNPFITAQIADSRGTSVVTNTSAANNSSDSSSVKSAGLGVTFHIHQSSIGGFFNRARVASEPSASPSPPCSACYAKLEACDVSLECRALSACFSAYVDSDPALYASLLLSVSSSLVPITHDVSWLLEQCLGGEQQTGDNRWTYSVLLQFLDGLLCASSAQCPIETSAAAIAGSTNSSSPSDSAEAGDLGQSLVLRYMPMEQTLTFVSTDFASTLEFLVVVEGDAGTDGIETGVRSQIFSNLTRDESSLSALSEMLMGLYRGQQSSASIASNNSTNSSSSTPFVRVVRGDTDGSSTNDSDAEVLRIQYFFLPTWTSYFGIDNAVSRSELLPYVQTVLGDSPVVKTVSPVERLELVVVDS